MVETITRYGLEADREVGDSWLAPDRDGEWVRFEDHAKAIDGSSKWQAKAAKQAEALKEKDAQIRQLKEDKALLLRDKREARDRAYALTYVIAGGEDAPGLLDSIPTEGLVYMLKEERRNRDYWTDAQVRQAVKDARAQPDTRGEDVAARERVIAAYIAGAIAVHNEWGTSREPDFSEAAHDYVAITERGS